MTHGPELHVKDGFEPITSAWSGRQAHPPPVGCRAHTVLEGHCRQVVALVNDDEPVTFEHFIGIFAARERLKSHQVYDAAAPRSAGAELANLPFLQTEQVA
jgi:hypothetical protein